MGELREPYPFTLKDMKIEDWGELEIFQNRAEPFTDHHSDAPITDDDTSGINENNLELNKERESGELLMRVFTENS